MRKPFEGRYYEKVVEKVDVPSFGGFDMSYTHTVYKPLGKKYDRGEKNREVAEVVDFAGNKHTVLAGRTKFLRRREPVSLIKEKVEKMVEGLSTHEWLSNKVLNEYAATQLNLYAAKDRLDRLWITGGLIGGAIGNAIGKLILGLTLSKAVLVVGAPFAALAVAHEGHLLNRRRRLRRIGREIYNRTDYSK